MVKTHKSALRFVMIILVLALWTSSTACEEFDSFEVIRRYPHDATAFTQGLVYHDGFLYEGTGLHGRSSLRKVRLEDGEVLDERALSDTLFGEGITILGDQIFQITWQEEQGFVYDLATLEQVGEFHYEGEGWGLTTDGQYLIMSNGSHILTYLDPESLEVMKELAVYGEEGPIQNLNELEYINGEIFANVWYDHRLCRIDPLTGMVLGWIDLSSLHALEKAIDGGVDVVNGIAYDHDGDRLFVTGKLWHHIYEIRLELRR